MLTRKDTFVHRILLLMMIMLMVSRSSISVRAEETSFQPDQLSYEGVTEEEISIDGSSSVSLFSYGEKSLGSFSVKGSDITSASYKGGDAYIGTGNISFVYSYSGSHQTDVDEDWNLVSSSIKKIGNLNIKKAIKKGVAIVQRSGDGVNWSDAVAPKTDYFNKFTADKGSLYSASEEELKKGTFFRVIIAYEMAHKTGTTYVVNNQFFSIPIDQYENRTFVEEYRFYLAYGKNPVIIRDLLSRRNISATKSVQDGFIIDKNGSSDKVTVAKDGGKPSAIDNGATFYEPGKYVIDIKSNIGSEYQYNIIVRSGTNTQSLAPQVFENIREGYAGNDKQITSTPETGIDSLTTLMIGQRGSADFTIGTVGAVEGIGIDSDQVEILLQLNDSSRLTDNGWKIQSDDWGKSKQQKIADTRTGAIRTGAVIVQTSSDGINWKNVEQDRYSDGLFTTDFYNNYRGKGLINLYSPSGDDVINGLYIRVFYAYKANNKSEKKDYRYLEKYEFYLCSSNLNAVTFHNLSIGSKIENVYGDEGENAVAIHKRMETMNSGAGTVTGFWIDTSLNPAVTYDVYLNDDGISNQEGEKYTETGQYEIKLRSPVGNKKTVVLYVDQSTDEEALNNYFGDSFIDGKRIYSEGEYPVFEGGKTTYNINAIPDTFLPISGTIKNITTGKTIEIISSRAAQSDVLDEAGDYIAEFSTNSNYEKDLRSGDNRKFTFHFSLIAAGNAPGPQVNKRGLYRYAQSKVSDSYPIYYGLTYQSAYKGNITLAFSSREDAAKYQNSYESGTVEVQEDGTYLYTGSFIVSQKDKYHSAWDLTDDVNYYANAAVTRSYFDMSEEAKYITLTDEVLEQNENLRTLELERSVVIFGDGEKEKLTDLKDALPIINDKPYAYIMPGVGEKTQRGFEGFQFIQDKYQCDSSSVEITDSKGETYSIEYLKDVGSQLKQYGCETGVVTITEKTIYGDKSEYEAVYINEGDITASVDVSCYKGGEIEDTITVTKDDVIDDLHVEGFSIASVVDELDPYDLILITCPDNSEAYFAADEIKENKWTAPGDYTVKIVNRLGYYFSFKITVDESEYTSVSINGEGTEATQDLYVRKGESNIKLPKLHRYGYNLEGYVDSEGNVYKNNTSNAKFNKSVVLEPIWKAKHFTVAFEDVNGDMISSYETSFGKEIVFPELSKDYVDDFVGWSLNGQSVGDNYRLDQENNLVFKMVTKGSREQ